MKPSMRLVLAGTLGVLACREPPVVPEGSGGLVVGIVLAPHTVLALDAGRILLRGPTSRDVSVTPGQTVTIDGLLPGSYTVALEGLVGGAVTMFGKQSNIQVVAGTNDTVPVSLVSFVPVVNPLPGLDTVKTIRVSYTAVQNAASYQIQADTDPSFALPIDVDVPAVTQTSVDIVVPNYGKYYVRVGAKNEYVPLGGWASAPRPITLVSPVDLATVAALAGDAFADALVDALSPGVRPTIRAAWSKCGTGAANRDLGAIKECVDSVESATVVDPTDVVLIAVLDLFVKKIRLLVGL